MKNKLLLTYFSLVLFMGQAIIAEAQVQTTGTPGTPQSTTTIDQKVVPNPPPTFKGTITPNAKDSKPYWNPKIVPPKGAPNVLLIMTDDAGYGVAETFGGVIPTPALDRVAKNGIRYTQFHSTALCSPTRAAILTGRNHHSVGFGVIAEFSTGFPGYDAEIGLNNASVGEILKQNGYATSWFGKNHNTPDFAYSVAGPFDQWPSGMGFDYFYGFMGGETNQWEPWLFRDHTQIFPFEDDPEFNLTTAEANEAIAHINKLNAVAPEQPFFVYYAPGASHAPHHPTKEWIDKFKGKFDMGWNEMREIIYTNQLKNGSIPAGTKLTPWPDDLKKWDSLSAEEKKVFARQAEIFAAYVAYSDYEIGRVIQAVEDMGKLDNTLIIYIEGDNGTSSEGSTLGTPLQWAAIQGINIPIADQLKYYDAWGSAETEPHIAVAWAWAFDTPFKWTKQVASHFGGTRQGMAISWPAKIKDVGTTRSQFHHVIDIVPTILEATGIQAPTMVNGIEQNPIEGVSMAYTWDKANTNAPSTRTTQYFEMLGNRAIYHEGWFACTTPDDSPWLMGLGKQTEDVMNGYNWELYNLNEDFSQYNDLAKKMPDKLLEMQQLFTMEAAIYNVFPLDNSAATRALTPRPSATAGKTEFVYTNAMVGIPGGTAPNTLGKSYKITAEVVLDANAEGVVVTRGGHFGGYGLYFLKGKPVFTYNFLGITKYKCEGKEALKAGKHTLVFDFKYDGGGFGKGGTGTLSVDGAVVATLAVEHTIPFSNVVDESFDIGNDTRSSVNSDDYSIPFKFTGELDKLTINLIKP